MSQVFESLNKSTQSGMAPKTPEQALAQIKADPIGYIRQLGYEVPQGVDLRNPNSIISAMMQSGQVPMSRYHQVLSRMQGRR